VCSVGVNVSVSPLRRLGDDDRLAHIIKQLRKGTPKVALPKGGPDAVGEDQSVKSALAEGLRDVREQLGELERRLPAERPKRGEGVVGAGSGRAGKARPASAGRR
jgi:hypothetical protein